jgi:hypothetical protein
VALSAERMAEWMAADLSELDLLIIQIDGITVDADGGQQHNAEAAGGRKGRGVLGMSRACPGGCTDAGVVMQRLGAQRFSAS